MQKNKNIAESILRVLKYFNIFKYPLNENEIHAFLDLKCSKEDLQATLMNLTLTEKLLYTKSNYVLRNKENYISRKEKGKTKAEKELKKAKLISKFISIFPFVKMVAISGSLSKGYADEKTDIDYFIITSEDNLWTCRTILHILKKITFIVNLQHSFCMNYFIAEDKLTIEEQNYYTAVELSTLIPIYGYSYYNKLMQANSWFNNFIPNNKVENVNLKEQKNGFLKSIFEYIFKSKKLNTFFMDFTDRRWRKKWLKKGISEADYELSFKTRRYVSKNHPSNYQKIILAKYNKS